MVEVAKSLLGANVYDSLHIYYFDWTWIFKSEYYTDLKCGRICAGIEN